MINPSLTQLTWRGKADDKHRWCQLVDSTLSQNSIHNESYSTNPTPQLNATKNQHPSSTLSFNVTQNESPSRQAREVPGCAGPMPWKSEPKIERKSQWKFKLMNLITNAKQYDRDCFIKQYKSMPKMMQWLKNNTVQND